MYWSEVWETRKPPVSAGYAKISVTTAYSAAAVRRPPRGESIVAVRGVVAAVVAAAVVAVPVRFLDMVWC